uniref:Ferritin/DPS protein domain-containing protein n=2 Tax=Methylophaga nitratireducenticrescens TaxID=754476 RepID=I1XN01_METNJ
MDEMDFETLSKSVPDGTVGDIKKVHQHNTELLLHKLGQRMAFERASVRLYEALIFKCLAARNGKKTVVSIDQLRQFRDEEVEHSFLLKTAIETLGFDPDEWIPDADSSLISSLQTPKVFTKKNSSVLSCLEAVLIFATNDNAEWHTLHELFTNMGLQDLAAEFNQALEEDSRQLETISHWIYQLSHA